MKRIRSWLRNYLGITILETNTKYRLDNFDKLVQVGIDYHIRGESWAVICIEGKAEYVQFATLSNNEARNLLHILGGMKQRKWRYMIDAPPFLKKELESYF